MKKNIVWLASYPKSGNTWFRIFLSNLRSEKAVPIDINEIQTDGIFSSRGIFEKATGIVSNHLTPDETDAIRPEVFRYYANRFEEQLFIKAHDAYTYLPTGEPLFPTDATYGVIYFVRNPLDVAVSWAFHNGKNTEKADKAINEDLTIIKKNNRYQNQIRQKLLTWQQHVLSWTTQTNIPILLLRYEDMRAQPLATFKKAVEFLGWEYTDEAIQTALDKSSFKTLKAQEQEKGFNERQTNQKSFFRSGKIKDWESHLTAAQIENIINHNRAIMKQLNYEGLIE